MIEIIPALLVKNFQELQRQLEEVRGLVPLVQVDMVDGMFAPARTWPLTDQAHFDQITSGDEGLPYWEDIDYEFDLMVTHPSDEAERCIRAGASRLVLHAANPHTREALEHLQQYRSSDDFAVSLGVALLPDTSIETVALCADLIDYVQVMGIETVGRQGQPFAEQSLGLIRAIQQKYPALVIQVDGAVSLENTHALIDAGATRLVVGSGIFGAQNPREALQTFQQAAKSA